MNFSGYELQIFVSVLIVLGCAFVALLVDYLKGSNEKLRESHVELLARQDIAASQPAGETSAILKALSDQTSALRAIINRPIQVTTAAPAPASLSTFPVSSIPSPKRQFVANAAPEREKVKVARIPETRVAAAAEPEATLPTVAAEPEVAPAPPEILVAPALPQAEEVLPPNVIRIRLMPDLNRRETKAAPVEAVEPVEVAEETVALEPEMEPETPSIAEEVVAVAESPLVVAPEPAEIVAQKTLEAELTEAEPVLEEVQIEAILPEEEMAPVALEAEESSTNGTATDTPVVAAVETETHEAEALKTPDFDQFLEELVAEFAPHSHFYSEAPSAESPRLPYAFEPTPLTSMSALPILPQLNLHPDGELLLNHEAESNLEEFMPNLVVPSGIHPVDVFSGLLERKELLTGLVVSVGINEYGQLHENLGAAADELLRSVDGLMTGLAGIDGFCTRKKPDEFVLIFAKLSGSAAQRRLSELSEQLWDFQLRNLGTFSVVFSWGAKEVQRENLSEAVAAATERMKETQSSRKSVSMDRSRRRRATA
ncbi:hypothetical protein [Bryobacter aggregatus]|uniref:hypothetical protein n=1 Tax=Bryobacter aggregatus TaxID=360054 RepID=UPI0004E1D495|nr:hypothetical protein [Bryobacter aggregatus]